MRSLQVLLVIMLIVIAFALSMLVRGGCHASPVPSASLTPEPVPSSRLPLSEIKLPPGFSISVYTEQTPNAREMCLSPSGTLFLGSMSAGNVYAVRDEDGDGYAEKVLVAARGLHMPVGVAFRDGSLYVSEVSRIWRYDNIEAHLGQAAPRTLVRGDFPTAEHHGWKFIAFGPDGLLYVPVGAPCNVCEQADTRFASIMRMQPDGKQLELFASGIRNTVGFDWDPRTHELWFTDNGRDMLGDDIPPDELNHASRAGMHFGFPYFHGMSIPDPDFAKGHNAGEFTESVQALGPHVAALGMRFYTGAMFPAQYRGQIFIAEHGSWNRSVPLGARVTLVSLQDGQAVGYEVFAEGWQRPDGSRWGRPADVLVMPDGSLLVSDDLAGAVYRITYKAP
jgi:glucose/arabinose dehydrogenase